MQGNGLIPASVCQEKIQIPDTLIFIAEGMVENFRTNFHSN